MAARAHAMEAGALVRRLVRAPVLSDPDAARARVAEWLRAQSDRALAELLDGVPFGRAVLEGIADGSPYLRELVEADAGRLLRLLRSDPDIHLSTLLNASARAVAAAARDDEAMRALRRVRSEAALLIALADIGGVWDVM